jgi:integrase
MTVGEFLLQWLDAEVRPRRRATTYELYRRCLRKHLLPGLGSVPLAALDAERVEVHLNARLASGLAPATVDLLHAILRCALSRAVRWKLLGQNAASLVASADGDPGEVVPLSPEQSHLLLSGLEGELLGDLCALALSLGLRSGELRGLRWQDVDLEAGYLHVRQTIQRAERKLQAFPPKTERSRRTLPLPPLARRALLAQKERQSRQRQDAGARWQDWDLVFSTSVGTPIDPANLARDLNRALIKLGLPCFGIHRLRHTCAAYLVSSGVDQRIVMEVLGHQDIALTADLYGHVLPAASAAAMTRLESVLAATEVRDPAA